MGGGGIYVFFLHASSFQIFLLGEDYLRAFSWLSAFFFFFCITCGCRIFLLFFCSEIFFAGPFLSFYFFLASPPQLQIHLLALFFCSYFFFPLVIYLCAYIWARRARTYMYNY
ncbi:hypothetical protein DFH27DRAFT_534116 [Peziza echinospora]|nr:hypothetical protein DFH27DRAFT_534116 [Peziza echinospora]